MVTNSLRNKMMTGVAVAGLAAALMASGCSTTVQEARLRLREAVEGGWLRCLLRGYRIPRSRCCQVGSGTRGWRGASLDKSQRSMEQLHQDTVAAG